MASATREPIAPTPTFACSAASVTFSFRPSAACDKLDETSCAVRLRLSGNCSLFPYAPVLSLRAIAPGVDEPQNWLLAKRAPIKRMGAGMLINKRQAG